LRIRTEATFTEIVGEQPDFSTVRKRPFGSEIACSVMICVYIYFKGLFSTQLLPDCGHTYEFRISVNGPSTEIVGEQPDFSTVSEDPATFAIPLANPGTTGTVRKITDPDPPPNSFEYRSNIAIIFHILYFSTFLTDRLFLSQF
jgi:hypothetical protein